MGTDLPLKQSFFQLLSAMIGNNGLLLEFIIKILHIEGKNSVSPLGWDHNFEFYINV